MDGSGNGQSGSMAQYAHAGGQQMDACGCSDSASASPRHDPGAAARRAAAGGTCRARHVTRRKQASASPPHSFLSWRERCRGCAAPPAAAFHSAASSPVDFISRVLARHLHARQLPAVLLVCMQASTAPDTSTARPARSRSAVHCLQPA